MVRGSNPIRGVFSSFSNRAEGLWGPPTLLLRGCRRSFLGVKRAGCEVNHSSLSSAEVNNDWTAITFVITKYEGGAFEGPGVDERRTLKSIERHEIWLWTALDSPVTGTSGGPLGEQKWTTVFYEMGEVLFPALRILAAQKRVVLYDISYESCSSIDCQHQNCSAISAHKYTVQVSLLCRSNEWMH